MKRLTDNVMRLAAVTIRRKKTGRHGDCVALCAPVFMLLCDVIWPAWKRTEFKRPLAYT